MRPYPTVERRIPEEIWNILLLPVVTQLEIGGLVTGFRDDLFGSLVSISPKRGLSSYVGAQNNSTWTMQPKRTMDPQRRWRGKRTVLEGRVRCHLGSVRSIREG